MNLDAVTLQAGRDNSHTFRLCVTLDRDRLDTTSHRPRQLPVGRDEGVGLELCEGDVLGVVRRPPPEVFRDLPRVRFAGLYLQRSGSSAS